MNRVAQQGQEAHSQLATQTGSGGKQGIQLGLCWDTPGTRMTHGSSSVTHVASAISEGAWQAQGRIACNNLSSPSSELSLNTPDSPPIYLRTGCSLAQSLLTLHTLSKEGRTKANQSFTYRYRNIRIPLHSFFVLTKVVVCFVWCFFFLKPMPPDFEYFILNSRQKFPGLLPRHLSQSSRIAQGAFTSKWSPALTAPRSHHSSNRADTFTGCNVEKQ